MLVKLRFRANVARSGDLVCRDTVRVLCAYVRGVLIHFPPPLGGAPTRFRSRISVEEYSTEDHTIPMSSFYIRCLGKGIQFIFNGNFFIYRAIYAMFSGIFSLSPSVLKM